LGGKYNLTQSLLRACQLLDIIAEESEEVGVTVLAKRAGLHKSTCFGLLYTLQHLRLVYQDPKTGKYRLGLKAFELGQSYTSNLDLRRLAHPYLEQLVRETQETVHLVLLEGDHAVYIDKVEGRHAMSIASRIGQQAKLYCTGVGKALLAFWPEEKQRQWLEQPLVAYTKNTIVDRGALMQHLREIRERGYSVDDQEIEIGLRCVSAPIFNAQGSAEAAISISGPETRINDDKLTEYAQHILKASQEISRQLGYRP